MRIPHGRLKEISNESGVSVTALSDYASSKMKCRPKLKRANIIETSCKKIGLIEVTAALLRSGKFEDIKKAIAADKIII